MKAILYISFIISLFHFISCEQPVPNLKLNKDDYKIIDSLVVLKKKQMNKEIDSICKYMDNDFYDQAVDSITIVRMDYIKKSLNE